MPSLNQIKGSFSEDTALRYFQSQGYEFIARNVSLAGIEVDLIFKKQNVYYIIEVKSENLWSFDRPVSYKQVDRLKKAVEVFSDAKQASVRLFTAIVCKKDVQVYPLDDD